MNTSTATTTLALVPVSREVFLAAFRAARGVRPVVADATSAPEEWPTRATFYLTDDRLSGFGVTCDGYGFALFSATKGRGDALVDAAIAAGWRYADHFDGYLTALYARHGFSVRRREANWTPGEPDVLFISLTA